MAETIGAQALTAKQTDWTALGDGRDAVQRTFKFADFKTAWAFMSGAALKAEQMDHHPEWLNVFNTVNVTLTTHDAGGVTEKDLELAAFMDVLAGRLAGGSA